MSTLEVVAASEVGDRPRWWCETKSSATFAITKLRIDTCLHRDPNHRLWPWAVVEKHAALVPDPDSARRWAERYLGHDGEEPSACSASTLAHTILALSKSSTRGRAKEPGLPCLRAALREAIHIISHFPTTQLADEAVERFKALADAPPTVAELLTALPDPPNGRSPGAHRVEWEHDDMRIRAMRYGLAGLVVERRLDGEWSRTNLNHADLTQPARLVEVA